MHRNFQPLIEHLCHRLVQIKMKLANLGHSQKSVPVFSFAFKLVGPSGFCYAFVIIILSSQICVIFTARRHG